MHGIHSNGSGNEQLLLSIQWWKWRVLHCNGSGNIYGNYCHAFSDENNTCFIAMEARITKVISATYPVRKTSKELRLFHQRMFSTNYFSSSSFDFIETRIALINWYVAIIIKFDTTCTIYICNNTMTAPKWRRPNGRYPNVLAPKRRRPEVTYPVSNYTLMTFPCKCMLQLSENTTMICKTTDKQGSLQHSLWNWKMRFFLQVNMKGCKYVHKHICVSVWVIENVHMCEHECMHASKHMCCTFQGLSKALWSMAGG